MYTTAEKPVQKTSRAVANQAAQKARNQEQAPTFEDNRAKTNPVRIAQRAITSLPQKNQIINQWVAQRAIELNFDDNKADDDDEHEYNSSSEERWPVNGDLYGKAKTDYEKAITNNTSLKSIYYNQQYKATTQYKPIQRSTVIQKLTAEKLVNTKNYGQAYYQYDYDGHGNIDDFSYNRATSLPKGSNPVVAPVIDLDDGVGGGMGQMMSGKIVSITGSTRSRHFSIADRIIDGTPSDRKGKYTWHHLTPKYKMVRVDMNVHLGSRGGFTHTGGKSFW